MATGAGGSDGGLSPEEAFGLLGNDTRVGILQALWDTFESGLGDNALSYSELFDRVDIRDSGNFSYHLEKLTGPYVRQIDEGYELKQTGINVVRAVVAGTVTRDPAIDPTPVDIDCPLCDAPIEVQYDDEAMLATCPSCAGLRRWADHEGFVFIGIVPPILLRQRPTVEAFRAAVTYTMYQIAALYDGVCPHCAGEADRRLSVCPTHEPGPTTHCPACHRHHLSEAVMVCRTCKWRVFPPAALGVITHPAVTAFYHDHGIDHRFASWEGVARSVHLGEELLAADPPRVRFSVHAGDEVLHVDVDADLAVAELTLG